MKKILVVEDDPVNSMILSDFLAANGYETIAAASGPEGIERFERDLPDLMLVDVQLPRKSGFEVVREIKAMPRGATTPILLMSAVYSDRDQSMVDRAAIRRRFLRGEPSESFRTVELGALADGYLAKPFDLVDLLDQVKQLLGPR